MRGHGGVNLGRISWTGSVLYFLDLIVYLWIRHEMTSVGTFCSARSQVFSAPIPCAGDRNRMGRRVWSLAANGPRVQGASVLCFWGCAVVAHQLLRRCWGLMSLSGRQAHVLQVFHSAALMIDHTGRCGARVTCAQQHVLQYAFYSLSCCVWVCPRTRIAYADIAARLMLHCAVRSRCTGEHIALGCAAAGMDVHVCRYGCPHE